ncbi:MAG: hypothetical protein LBD24_08175 [Spirochaetaceae bacterium]|nr:hypothetical protein [Spirochaetaceae bacterium]
MHRSETTGGLAETAGGWPRLNSTDSPNGHGVAPFKKQQCRNSRRLAAPKQQPARPMDTVLHHYETTGGLAGTAGGWPRLNSTDSPNGHGVAPLSNNTRPC